MFFVTGNNSCLAYVYILAYLINTLIMFWLYLKWYEWQTTKLYNRKFFQLLHFRKNSKIVFINISSESKWWWKIYNRLLYKYFDVNLLCVYYINVHWLMYKVIYINIIYIWIDKYAKEGFVSGSNTCKTLTFLSWLCCFSLSVCLFKQWCVIVLWFIIEL